MHSNQASAIKLIVTLVLALAGGWPGSAAALADLTVDEGRLAASVDFRKVRFRAADCAVQEGSVGNEISPLPNPLPRGGVSRRLLRFDVEIRNDGNADLFVGPPGDPALFEFSPCHGHYHLLGFTDYSLLDSNGTVVTGRKQAFCLMDVVQWDANAGPGKFTCSNQGISAGWAVVYDKSLDGQWIDITGVPPGSYMLKVIIDAGNLFSEADEGDNTAIVPVEIPKQSR